jgi:hypothetical protein
MERISPKPVRLLSRPREPGPMIRNDSPHFCLTCGKQFKVDSRAPRTGCPACDSSEIADIFHLDGRDCSFCKAGIFADDPDFWCVS